MRNLIIILFISLCTFHFALFTSTSYAVDSTSSASIKLKLEELKKEIASKAANIKTEISQKLQNKAYIGFIKSKSPNSVTIAAQNGTKIITLNQDTQYTSDVKKVKYSAKNITEEDYIAALGDIDDTGVLTAKKVILMEAPTTYNKTITWGQVTSTADNLTIKTNDLKNITVATSKNTNYQRGQDDIDYNSIKLNDFVIVVGQTKENKILNADFIYVIPQGGFIRSKKIIITQPNTASTSAKKK